MLIAANYLHHSLAKEVLHHFSGDLKALHLSELREGD